MDHFYQTPMHQAHQATMAQNMPPPGSNYDQQMKCAERDARPKLGELIQAAHSAIDNLEGGISNLEGTVGPVIDGEPVNQAGIGSIQPASNPAYLEQLMGIVFRIHAARSRIDSMASRLRI